MKKLMVGAVVLGFLAAAVAHRGSRPPQTSGTSPIRSANAELTLVIDRVKAALHGLTQEDIIKSINAATNSSISYDGNRVTSWIDDDNGTRYYIGVQYPEGRFDPRQDIQNIPLTSPTQGIPIPLGSVAAIKQTAWHGLFTRMMNWAAGSVGQASSLPLEKMAGWKPAPRD